MKVYYYEHPADGTNIYHATLAEAKKSIRTYVEKDNVVAVFLADVGPATPKNIAAIMNGEGSHVQVTYGTHVWGGKEPEED